MESEDIVKLIDARLRELRDFIREGKKAALNEAYVLLAQRSRLRNEPAFYVNSNGKYEIR
jgi:hypothetical protein